MYYNEGMFCPCCSMQLRLTSSNREGKGRLRQEREMVNIRNEHNRCYKQEKMGPV